MSDSRNPHLGGSVVVPPSAGPYTLWLVGIMVIVTVLVSVIDRGGSALFAALVFNRDAVLHGELWRLVTYPWLKPSPLSLLVTSVVMYLFFGTHERLWGGPKLLRFVLMSVLGAAILAVPVGLVLQAVLPFADAPIQAGPEAAFDALLMAMALRAPRSHVMFGFVLPMQARTFVWLMVAFEVVAGMMNEVSQLSITLGGLAMGYILTRGPKGWLHHWGTPWNAFLRRRARRGLYVVPPLRPNKTLH